MNHSELESYLKAIGEGTRSETMTPNSVTKKNILKPLHYTINAPNLYFACT